MTQSLYLDGRREPLQIGLYGTALQINRREAAPIFAPLRRTRRICCWGRVQWAGDALIACATYAIPISFLARGRAIACFMPARPPAKAFGALLEEAVLHPAWRERFENWIDNEIARSLAAVAGRQSDAWIEVRFLLANGGVRQALRAAQRIGGGGEAGRIWRNFQELLHAWTSARLLEEDFSPACFGYSSDKPNLPEHLMRALSPLLLPTLTEQCARESKRKRQDGPIDGAGEGSLTNRCALAFAGAEQRLAARMSYILRRFERLVRDCAEEVDPWLGS